ncbi:AAA family ATPase [Brevundimonas sp.]|uniref:ATP-dependent nuclease n=1 Tax=Brevundimonas sp. TaxID=1871086 RepID=UPI001A2872B2|nr:AAA family ATPase [Brevundimonas sp.]MBJ7510056.1 AAA family ATPase [Brevundimonas sp.]
MTDVAADVAIDVVFARSLAEARQAGLSDPAVVVTPDRNTWNDYGWQVFATITLMSAGDIAFQGATRLMFDGAQSTAPALDQVLANTPVLAVEQSPVAFVSLLPTPGWYRQILDVLGFDRTVRALAKLQDAAFARAVGPTEVQARLMDSPAFWEGMLRADDAYGALRRGLREVRRAPPQPVPDAATSFTVRARLPSSPDLHRVGLDFEPDVFGRNRISVLIGRNGVGKTQLLRRIIESCLDDHDAALVTLDPAPRFRRVLAFSSVTSDPYPRAIPPWAGVDYEYFSMTAPTEARGDALMQALVAIRRDRGDRLGQPQTFRDDLFTQVMEPYGLLRGLELPLRPLRGDQGLPGEQIRDGLRYFPFNGRLREQFELLLAGEIDWTRPVVISGPAGPRQLSSGETAILRFAAQAVAAIDQGSLLLFDEPETHLHPNFVSDFMEILQDLLERTASIAVIATHSAYVVREVPRDRVNVMSVADGVPTAAHPRLQTFGASIDSISQFVFNDGSISHWHQQRLRRWVEGPGRDLTLDQVIERHGADLNPETLSYIAELKRGGAGA